MAQPSVDVIVPAKDVGDTIRPALEAVRGQTYPLLGSVVVAASDSGTADAARDCGAVVVDNPSGRTPTGLNLALARTTAEVIARVDAHSVIPPGYLARAVQILIDTGADVVGGMQVPVGRTAWEKAIAAAMSSRLGAGDARYRIGGKPGRADTVYLGVFLKSTLERLGRLRRAFRPQSGLRAEPADQGLGWHGLVRSRTGSRLSTAGIVGRARPSVLRLWALEAGIRTSSSRVPAATSAGATPPRRRAQPFRSSPACGGRGPGSLLGPTCSFWCCSA